MSMAVFFRGITGMMDMRYEVFSFKGQVYSSNRPGLLWGWSLVQVSKNLGYLKFGKSEKNHLQMLILNTLIHHTTWLEVSTQILSLHCICRCISLIQFCIELQVLINV